MAQQKNEVQSLLEKAMFQQLLQILDGRPGAGSNKNKSKG